MRSSGLLAAAVVILPWLIVEACGGSEVGIGSDAGVGGDAGLVPAEGGFDGGGEAGLEDGSDAAQVSDAGSPGVGGADSSSDAGVDVGWHDLTNLSFWSKFDATTVNQYANSFVGGTFDGRYVYFAPDGSPPGAPSLALRYDTSAPFGTASSWESFDTTAYLGQTVAFNGAVFDGRFV